MTWFALSVTQPWAWAIFHGKPVENRTWPLPPAFIGRRVLIHTSRRVSRDEFDAAADTIELIDRTLRVPSFELLAMGAVIGAVTFAGDLPPTGEHQMEGWRVLDQHGWQMENQVELPEPVPCKGARGFWTVPPAVEKRIREMVAKL